MLNQIKEAYKGIRFFFRDIFYNRYNRKRLLNHDFSIICSDCTGGCVCKDLRVQMKSPTRNLYLNADAFIKFCLNLEHYLNTPLTKETEKVKTKHLTAMCDDIRLYLVHYDSFEQARIEWDRRRVRVNYNNIFFIMNDRNYCQESHIKAFDELPYPNKVCFTHTKYPQYKSTYYIPDSDDKDELRPVMEYIHQWWFKRYYDYYDFVTWLNNGLKSKK